MVDLVSREYTLRFVEDDLDIVLEAFADALRPDGRPGYQAMAQLFERLRAIRRGGA